jgi:hypothetical protein
MVKPSSAVSEPPVKRLAHKILRHPTVLITDQRWLQALEQPHLHVILFVAREMIRLCPALVLQVGDDVLAGHRSGHFAEEGDDLADAGGVMPLLPMPIAVLFRAGEGIEPAMDLGIGLAE